VGWKAEARTSGSKERTGTEKLKDAVAALMLDNGAMSAMATAYAGGLEWPAGVTDYLFSRPWLSSGNTLRRIRH
jgi:hypothetical protein